MASDEITIVQEKLMEGLIEKAKHNDRDAIAIMKYTLSTMTMNETIERRFKETLKEIGEES